MGIEGESVLEGRIALDLDAAVAASHEKMVASPVEDALVGLDGLAMLGEDAVCCSVNGHQEVILGLSVCCA